MLFVTGAVGFIAHFHFRHAVDRTAGIRGLARFLFRKLQSALECSLFGNEPGIGIERPLQRLARPPSLSAKDGAAVALAQAHPFD